MAGVEIRDETRPKRAPAGLDERRREVVSEHAIPALSHLRDLLVD
jgi:hypothetical protein